MTRIRPSRSHAAARLASFVLATSHLTLAQQSESPRRPTPRPTYKPRDSSWDYDDDGGPTTGDYVVTFIAIAIGMLVVACLFRALGHFILQSAVRARTQAWHAHSPHSPHSLRRASMRGHRGLDEQITGGSVGTPKTPKQKIIPLRDPETIVVAPEDNV